MTSELKTVSLTLRLLRKGKKVEDAFKDNSDDKVEELTTSKDEQARIFAGQVYSNPPDWAKFISQRIVSDIPDMYSGGAAGILFYPVGTKKEKRFMAVCFGHAHIALDLDAFEQHFGLKVALNTVPRSQLRTLDIATPDAVTFQRRIQASKDSDLQEFGINISRDLAQVAGGTPKDTKFAKFVAGKDSLSVTCRINPDEIDKKCKQIYKEYLSDNYKEDFSWVDNLKQVRDRDKLLLLDSDLYDAIISIKHGEEADLHMAPPEIVDYTEGGTIHYNGFGSNGINFYKLSIEDYIAEYKRCNCDHDIEEIKQNHRVKASKTGEEKLTEKWKVYDCFVYEAEVDGNSYVLFAGKWYEVDKDFKSQVEKYYTKILAAPSMIPSTTAKNEKELIEDLEKRADLVKLDCQKINPNGVRYANLEPCDFFSDKKQFIHLKDAHSSGPISHLWMQGVNSAEAFISDPKFRQDLRSKTKKLKNGFEKFLPMANQEPNRTDYEIIFGVMRPLYKDGSIGLPFFSKVSLRATAERLEQFNFPVSLHLIEKK